MLIFLTLATLRIPSSIEKNCLKTNFGVSTHPRDDINCVVCDRQTEGFGTQRSKGAGLMFLLVDARCLFQLRGTIKVPKMNLVAAIRKLYPPGSRFSKGSRGSRRHSAEESCQGDCNPWI